MGSVTWHRDDRPLSWRTRLYVADMRLTRDKQAFEGAEHTLRTAREKQAQGKDAQGKNARGDADPDSHTRAACRVHSATRRGLRLWIVEPRRQPPRRTVLYLHGGRYIHPLTPDYWRLVRVHSIRQSWSNVGRRNGESC